MANFVIFFILFVIIIIITPSVCLQCVRIRVKPVFSSSDLEPGDHVVIKKDLYEDHAIIISKTVGDTFEVVEVSNSKSGGTTAFSKSSSIIATILIHDKKFNFDKQNIGVVKYKKSYKKDEIVKRAKEFQKNEREKNHYYWTSSQPASRRKNDIFTLWTVV